MKTLCTSVQKVLLVFTCYLSSYNCFWTVLHKNTFYPSEKKQVLLFLFGDLVLQFRVQQKLLSHLICKFFSLAQNTLLHFGLILALQAISIIITINIINKINIPSIVQKISYLFASGITLNIIVEHPSALLVRYVCVVQTLAIAEPQRGASVAKSIRRGLNKCFGRKVSHA